MVCVKVKSHWTARTKDSSAEAFIVSAAVRAVSCFNVVAEYVYSLLSGCQFV